MTELLTARQMRDLEQAAMQEGIVTGLELMERAGQGVVEAIFTKWPDLTEGQHRALVLCGPGNNGGDGFVIARLLVEAGWQADVFLLGEVNNLPPDARANRDRWCAIGPVETWDSAAIKEGPRPTVIVDAVFGTGLTRGLPLAVANVLSFDGRQQWKEAHNIRKVAVDCPSGLNADTGHFLSAEEIAGDQTRQNLNEADLTVTFHTPKVGHYLQQGPSLGGQLVVADIGLRGDAMERGVIGICPGSERVRLTEGRHFGEAGLSPVDPNIWPLGCIPKMHASGHKYDFGNVHVFAGGVGHGGAGRLAARAALRAGAGLVTVICPPAALQENAAQLDAVMLRALRDDQPLDAIADDRVTGFCLGPGMGVSSKTRMRVSEALSRERSARAGRKPVVVLDADALSSFAEAPDELFALAHPHTILTPHDGEFARLFPDLAQYMRDGGSKVDAVRAAAQRAGCVVLLKGPDTVIAEPGGGACLHAASYDRSVPWLATAGAGDVLAGLIVGLAASPRAPDLIVAAEVAVWLHVQAALEFGPGLIAEDLTEILPAVLRDLSRHSGVVQSS